MVTALRIALVSVPLTIILFMFAPGTEASSQITLHLEPGTNDPSSSGFTRLWCGWHSICDGVADDPNYGALDFHTYRPEDNVVGAPVLWRMRAYYNWGGSGTPVGTIFRTGTPNPIGCDYTYGYMYRLDGSYIGRAIYTHVSPWSNYTGYIYGGFPYYNNINTWGTYADDSRGCPWTGYHVHQDAQLNYPAIVTDYARGNYPCEVYSPPTCESACVECGWAYPIWYAPQVTFHYYHN